MGWCDLGGHKYRIERCDQCNLLRFAGGHEWVPGGAGWQGRLWQYALDWGLVEDDDEVDDIRWSTRTLPYRGDSRGSNPYGIPTSEPVLPREYGADSHWESIPREPVSPEAAYGQERLGQIMGGGSGGGGGSGDNSRWLP